MSEDLKPCPFCGGNAKRYYRADDSGWENTDWVGCTDGCGASTACYETKALAVTVWNTRIDTDDMADRIEELETQLAKEIEISNQRGNHIEFILTPQMSDLQFQLKDVKAKLVEYKMVAGAIDKRWAESEDEVAELEAKLAELEPKDGRPCSTDEFLAVLLDEIDDYWDTIWAIKEWVEGDWVNAVRGTTLAELKGESDE